MIPCLKLTKVLKMKKFHVTMKVSICKMKVSIVLIKDLFAVFKILTYSLDLLSR